MVEIACSCAQHTVLSVDPQGGPVAACLEQCVATRESLLSFFLSFLNVVTTLNSSSNMERVTSFKLGLLKVQRTPESYRSGQYNGSVDSI